MKTVRSVLAEAPLAWLLLAVPVTAWVHHARPIPVAGVRPRLHRHHPAGWPARAGDREACDPVGEGIGGLLNATLGNAAELIITIVALRAGMLDVVKASLTGSIIGNLLLVLGAAFLAGGLKHPVQTFATIGARSQVGMMALAAIAIIVPSVFATVAGGKFVAQSASFSVVVSVILLAVYLLGLVFTLGTHAHFSAATRR